MKKPIYRRGYYSLYRSRGYFCRMCRRFGYYLYKKSGGGLVDPIQETIYCRIINCSVNPIKVRAKLQLDDRIGYPSSSELKKFMAREIATELINSELITVLRYRNLEENPYLTTIYCELEVIPPSSQPFKPHEKNDV